MNSGSFRKQSLTSSRGKQNQTFFPWHPSKAIFRVSPLTFYTIASLVTIQSLRHDNETGLQIALCHYCMMVFCSKIHFRTQGRDGTREKKSGTATERASKGAGRRLIPAKREYTLLLDLNWKCTSWTVCCMYRTKPSTLSRKFKTRVDRRWRAKVMSACRMLYSPSPSNAPRLQQITPMLNLTCYRLVMNSLTVH